MNSILLFIGFISSFMIRPAQMMLTHVKCRGGLYPRSSVKRFSVPDDKISWSVEYQGYNPPNHTANTIHGKPWADPEIGDPSFNPNWNTLDNNVNRESYTGQYQIEKNYPLNPIGRTGMCGRGVLGRWGPNHAADPVVTRWKRAHSGEVQLDNSNKSPVPCIEPILQFVAIKRGDTGEWALPGGMVDPGEKVTATAVREFQEEAVNSLIMSEADRKAWEAKFKSFFSKGEEVYKGYIDDPRNTDNSWMESVAYNFHDDKGDVVGGLDLNAGDDAVGVKWVDATPDIKLYASHKDIVKEVLKRKMSS